MLPLPWLGVAVSKYVLNSWSSASRNHGFWDWNLRPTNKECALLFVWKRNQVL